MVLRERLMEVIGTLGLYGMKSTLEEILAAGKTRATPDKILCDLLEAELAERQVRSIRYRMGLAKFPLDKDLDQFDFTASPINEMQSATSMMAPFCPTTPTSSWSGEPAPAKRIWPLPSLGKVSGAAGKPDFSTYSTW